MKFVDDDDDDDDDDECFGFLKISSSWLLNPASII